MLTGFKRNVYLGNSNVQVPALVDWRSYGAVTPVKEQGSCAACWSFSATGALEGQHFIRTGTLISLSEQNLLDCSNAFGNEGCIGGLSDYAFKYIQTNGGVNTEAAYPYEGRPSNCRYNPNIEVVTLKGFVDIPRGDENKLTEAIANVGPIAIALDASHPSFAFYSEGIYYEPACSSQVSDHTALAVGYGTIGTNTDYYLVKNSWGTNWGEKGYVRMARNKNNNCAIATYASYPLI